MEKLPNLEWGFSIIVSSWKNKTPTTSTETFRMVINFWKSFLQTQSFSIVWNQKQMLFVFRKTRSRERKLPNFKRPSKLLLRMQKLYQITYIFCNTLSSVSIHPFYTNWLAPREKLGLEWICRVQIIIHTTHLPFCLPWNYVTSPLTYSRG